MNYNFHGNNSKFYLSKYYAFVSNKMRPEFHEEIKIEERLTGA